MNIFMEQMRMGASVLICSEHLERHSRWIWWVRSSVRLETSLVT